MAIAGRRTVWILGAGFSRSLGAPLLVSLFRQQHLRDLQETLHDDRLATTVAWSQAVFNHGKDVEHLWDDGEEFLSFVDAAFGADQGADAAKQAELKGLFQRTDYLRKKQVSDLANPYLSECIQDPASAVRRALAFEASRFLRHPPADELLKPYQEWVKSLSHEHDSIITFNYDTLLETLGKPLQVVMPSEAGVPAGVVPVFKLHGSADWETDQYLAVKCIRAKNAVDANVPLAIAAPGRSKAALTGSLFHSLWKAAKVKLREAAEVVVIGYSFPKTDALARMTLLDSIADENCGVRVRRVSLVLGPDVDLPGNRRVLELLRHRMGRGREIRVNSLSPEVHEPSYRGAVINQHRLWAEDFIGDYYQRAGEHLP